MRRLGAVTSVLAVACLAAGCAQGTSDSDETSDASFDSGAKLSGEVEVMGFGAGDEIATVRLDRGEGGARRRQGQARSRATSTSSSSSPPWPPASRRSSSTPSATRSAPSPPAARSSRSTDCIEGEGIDTSRLPRVRRSDEVTFADEVYGIPEFNVVQIIQANADLLEQAGLTRSRTSTGPTGTRSLAANKELMKQRRAASSRRSASTASCPEFLPLWAKANGADLISEDGRTAQLDDPAVVEALEFAVGDLRRAGRLRRGQGASATPRTSSATATSSPAARSARCRWSSGTSTCSTTSRPTRRWPSTPCATAEGEPIACASGSAWAIPKGSTEPRGGLPHGAGDDRDRHVDRRPPRRGSRCARRRAASSPASSPATSEADEADPARWCRAERRRRRGTPRSRRRTRPTTTPSRCRPTRPARSSRRPGRTRSTGSSTASRSPQEALAQAQEEAQAGPRRGLGDLGREVSVAAPRRGRARRRARRKRRRGAAGAARAATALLFISPWIIGFLVFTACPVLYTGYLSLTDYDVINDPTFVGLDNYERAARGPEGRAWRCATRSSSRRCRCPRSCSSRSAWRCCSTGGPGVGVLPHRVLPAEDDAAGRRSACCCCCCFNGQSGLINEMLGMVRHRRARPGRPTRPGSSPAWSS